MVETFFCADLHLGHKQILVYEKEHRPFETVEEMNETIIKNWNSVVKPKDIIYVLGDFAFGRANIYLANRLNGHKRLVLGNHDYSKMSYYAYYFEKIFGMTYWKQCILSHMPIHSYNRQNHHESYGIDAPIFLNVHGHLHSRCIMRQKKILYTRDKMGDTVICGTPFELEEDPYYFNVSVERHSLTPVHADLILDRCKEIL